MLNLYFDGCCEPNNPGGHMGVGFVVKRDASVILRGNKYFSPKPTNTNNIAEYFGLILGLAVLKNSNLVEDLKIFGDSQLVINQMSGKWQCRNENLLKVSTRVVDLLKFFPFYSFTWIERELNTLADEESKKCLPDPLVDKDSILPFGRFKGKKVSEVPLPYLYWLAERPFQPPFFHWVKFARKFLLERHRSRIEESVAKEWSKVLA